MKNSTDASQVSAAVVQRPSWLEYFMEMAQVASKRSLVPTVKVGAVITTVNNTVISTGYNDFCRGIAHTDKRYADPIQKRLFTVHAEENAILAAARLGSPLDGASVYITSPPCTRCLNAMIQCGIHDCFYLEEMRSDHQLNDRDRVEEAYRLTIEEELAGSFCLYRCSWNEGRLVIARPLHPMDVDSTKAFDRFKAIVDTSKPIIFL